MPTANEKQEPDEIEQRVDRAMVEVRNLLEYLKVLSPPIPVAEWQGKWRELELAVGHMQADRLAKKAPINEALEQLTGAVARDAEVVTREMESVAQEFSEGAKRTAEQGRVLIDELRGAFGRFMEKSVGPRDKG